MPAKFRTGPCGQKPKDQGVGKSIGPAAGMSGADVEEERLAGKTTWDRAGRLEQVTEEEGEDGWMKMDMKMAVDVVQRQAGAMERGKLGFDFPSERGSEISLKEITESCADGMGVERTVGLNQTGERSRIGRASATDQG